MTRTIACGCFVALSTVLAGSAQAQCGAARSGPPAMLLASREYRVSAAVRARVVEPASRERVAKLIVGLWDVKFISDGALYDEGFDQYHDDGLEMMIDAVPPSSGNACLGVWTQSHSTIKLKHPFWIFDVAGVNVIGRGLILEEITLDRGGDSYTGTFSFQFRDLDGNPLSGMPDVSGTLDAERITTE